MKRLLFILFGLIAFLPVQSQETLLDELFESLLTGYMESIAQEKTQKSQDYSWIEDVEVVLSAANDDFDKGKYDKALENYLIVENFLAEYDKENEYYYYTTYALAMLYMEIVDYSTSEAYFYKALEVLTIIEPTPTENLFLLLNNLSILYSRKEDYQAALVVAEKTLNIAESVYGKNHVSYATALNNLGLVYFDKGNYELAEFYFTEAVSLLKEITGENSEDYASTLNNLGLLYKKIGDNSNAEKCLLTALKIRKQISDVNLLDYLQSLINLGWLYLEGDNYEEAEKYYSQAMDVLEDIDYESNKSLYANTLNHIGVCLSYTGELELAEQLLLNAVNIQKDINGDSSIGYAVFLYNLADLYANTGNFESAETYFQKVIYICDNYYNEGHLDYASILQNIGNSYYIYTNDRKKAEYYFKQSASMLENIFATSVNYMSEKQREMFWNSIKDAFENIYPNFCYKVFQENKNIAFFSYDNELFHKGILLNSSNAISQSILESGDSELIEYWRTLVKIKEELAQLQERNPQSSQISEDEKLVGELEKAIITLSADYRANMRQWQITWDSVRNALSPSQVAIEFFSATLVDTDSTMYCALLLRSNSSRPELIPLFEEKEVQALLNIGNPNLINRTYTYNGSGNALAQYIWGKILPYVRQGETIFFAPAGMLHQIAIEALPFDQTRTMADVFNLVRLSSTREIVLNKKSLKHTTAALYGGINYGNPAEPSPDKALTREGVTYLPGTKTEVEQIGQMLQDNHLLVRLYTADRADEESFKALSGKHQNILHIATHGFYWAEDVAKNKDYFAKRRMMSIGHDMPVEHEIDPLNRCGLLLAGANTAWTGHVGELPQNTQDGILTAKEISLMDLRDADMVVLSACETGKGEVTGEGVFGLQRAFKQAGAQTIIMSLWPVSDEATQLLMSEFYRNWINLHQSKRQAFVNAQNQVRSEYILPVFWAGFIMLD